MESCRDHIWLPRYQLTSYRSDLIQAANRRNAFIDEGLPLDPAKLRQAAIYCVVGLSRRTFEEG
jgi:hypothetical protein